MVALLGALFALNLAVPPAAANHSCASAQELPRVAGAEAGVVTGSLSSIGQIRFYKVYLESGNVFEAAVSGVGTTGIWFVSAWYDCNGLFAGSYAGAFVAGWSGWYYLHVDAVASTGSYVLQYAGN